MHVFTNGTADTRDGFEFYTRTPEQAVARWKEQGFRRVYVDGGKLIGQFLAAGLVDDLTLTVVPVLLGSGKPLFQRIPTQIPLRLTEVRAFPSGMVQLQHQRLVELEVSQPGG